MSVWCSYCMCCIHGLRMNKSKSPLNNFSVLSSMLDIYLYNLFLISMNYNSPQLVQRYLTDKMNITPQHWLRLFNLSEVLSSLSGPRFKEEESIYIFEHAPDVSSSIQSSISSPWQLWIYKGGIHTCKWTRRCTCCSMKCTDNHRGQISGTSVSVVKHKG